MPFISLTTSEMTCVHFKMPEIRLKGRFNHTELFCLCEKNDIYLQYSTLKWISILVQIYVASFPGLLTYVT